MRIRKVKWSAKDGVLFLEWEKESTGSPTEWDKFSAEYKDEPAPRFFTALQALDVDCLSLGELAKAFDVSRIKVRSVSFSYGGEMEVMGATISFGVELMKSSCPLSINTPHKPSAPYTKSDPIPNQCLAPETVKKLEEVQECALAYLNGERAQTEIDLAKIAGKPLTAKQAKALITDTATIIFKGKEL